MRDSNPRWLAPDHRFQGGCNTVLPILQDRTRCGSSAACASGSRDPLPQPRRVQGSNLRQRPAGPGDLLEPAVDARALTVSANSPQSGYRTDRHLPPIFIHPRSSVIGVDPAYALVASLLRYEPSFNLVPHSTVAVRYPSAAHAGFEPA